MITEQINNPFWHDAATLLVGKPEPDITTDLEAWRTWHRSQVDQWQYRDAFCRKYAWAVADPASLDFVAKHLSERAVEIGAGNGYFCPRDVQTGHIIEETTKTWFPVQQGGPEMLDSHVDRTLFLCWPVMDDMALQCLQHYQGKRLVYIGESAGGCNADDAFFEELEQHWQEVATHRIVQWYGIHDEIVVYERNR